MLAFCLKKKSSKICFLKPRKCGKGHPASGALRQQKAPAAVSCRGSKLHWKRSCCQLKHCLLSHPRTNCVHGGGIRSAGSSCRGLKKGNSGTRATGTGSRSSVSKAAPQKTMRCVLLASRQPWISTCFNPKPPLSKATSQENFQKRKGEKITQTNEIRAPPVWF